jgi:hypothetical protein
MRANILPTSWKLFDSSKSQNYLKRRIFFHETSGHAKLSMIQCCAVESAALNNPDWHIKLFVRPSNDCFTNSAFHIPPPNFHNRVWLEVLSIYPNVEIVLLNEKNYFSGTPLEDWYRRGEWRNSQYEMAHLSDYIRILTMYKIGGLYLDIDILTLKPFTGDLLKNFLVYGSSRMDHISNGVIHLRRGHRLLREIIKMLAKDYDPTAYLYHGPEVVSEVMKNMCGLVTGKSISNKCTDVVLLPDYLFYPIPSIISPILFQNFNNLTHTEWFIKINNSFGLHLWNSISHLQNSLNISSSQIVANIARQQCPTTVKRSAEF